jgi:hypothetical protein
MNFFNNKELITLGDFNKNLNTNEFRKSWDQMITNNGFQQIIKDMTRVNENSSILIDHIYVNKTQNISNCGVIIVNTSDHFPVFVSQKINFKLKRRKETYFSITYRRWKNVVDRDCSPTDSGRDIVSNASRILFRKGTNGRNGVFQIYSISLPRKKYIIH